MVGPLLDLLGKGLVAMKVADVLVSVQAGVVCFSGWEGGVLCGGALVPALPFPWGVVLLGLFGQASLSGGRWELSLTGHARAGARRSALPVSSCSGEEELWLAFAHARSHQARSPS